MKQLNLKYLIYLGTINNNSYHLSGLFEKNIFIIEKNLERVTFYFQNVSCNYNYIRYN